MDLSEFIEVLNNFTQQIVQSPEFQQYGILILFLWTIIPSIKAIIPEFFSFALLMAGKTPVQLIIVSSLGATIGDYVLYLLGRGSFRLFKGRNKDIAEADHLLHRFRLPIFLGTPFLSIIGDAIVFTAGVERIGFIRIVPFLLTGQFLRMTIGMLALLGIISLPEFFGI